MLTRPPTSFGAVGAMCVGVWEKVVRQELVKDACVCM